LAFDLIFVTFAQLIIVVGNNIDILKALT